MLIPERYHHVYESRDAVIIFDELNKKLIFEFVFISKTFMQTINFVFQFI